MKRVLVIGKSGQFARCLMDEWSRRPGALKLQNLGTGDCNIAPFLKGYLEAFAPDAIINTAIFSDLRACELDFDTAFRVNALGVANILEAMPEGCHLYHLSTDYVFSGWSRASLVHQETKETVELGEVVRAAPYTVQDPTKPGSNYARTKRAGELIALDSGRATVIRTASLFSKYGSSGKGGSNFLLGMLKKAGEDSPPPGSGTGPYGVVTRSWDNANIGVDSEVVMSPTYTPWLARAILAMIEEKQKPPLAHIVCDGPPVSWYGFARAIFEVGGFPDALARLVPKKTDDWSPRPRFSALENSLPELGMGTWQSALEHFFAEEWPKIKEA